MSPTCRSTIRYNPQEHTPVVVGGTDRGTDALQRLTTMRHVHLPKLVEYGFVEWDEAASEVAMGPDFAGIRPLLELLDDHDEELPAGWL